MSDCVPFAAKKALIFHQADYSLMRLVVEDFGNLSATKRDAETATHIAHGFGIKDKDIVSIENMTIAEIDQKVNAVKREF